jgi:hypothetical protein
MGCILSVLLVAAQAERETIKRALPELNTELAYSLRSATMGSTRVARRAGT